jgi:mRNA interferase MazF
MTLRKWDVAWAGLDPAKGHEQAGRRLFLVFCNDAISEPLGLVSIIPMTTWKKGRIIYPTEILIPKGSAALRSPSLALAHQIRTVSTKRLTGPAGRLEDATLRAAVEKALKLWLDWGA